MRTVREIVEADAAYKKNIFGKGIGIAVLDSGAFPHMDFLAGGSRIRAFYDLVNHREAMYDDNGHGTHICGIAAGNGAASAGEWMGMAPEAELIIVKILDHHGNGTVQQVLKGIEWVIAHRQMYGIRILNISVGSMISAQSEAYRELVAGVEYAWDQGLVVVTPAGNNGPATGTITAPGISRKVITVGAASGSANRRQDEKNNLFSGRGPTAECVCKPDIVAPGHGICACASGSRRSSDELEYYSKRSGTSMSAPVVSGSIALTLSANPEYTNKEIKKILRSSAVSLGLPRNYQGHGMVNVRRMLSQS